jgi:hypothetical protein
MSSIEIDCRLEITENLGLFDDISAWSKCTGCFMPGVYLPAMYRIWNIYVYMYDVPGVYIIC